MARPRVIGFRLSPEEHSRLAAAAQAGGLTPSAWSRRAVLDQLAAGAPSVAAATAAGVAAATAAAAAGAVAAGAPAAGAAATASAVPPAAATAPAAPAAPPAVASAAAIAEVAAAAHVAAAGAPPEPLSRVAGAKLTPSQYLDLELRAKAAGLPIGTYLRRLITGRPPTARWPLARAAIVQLAKAGTNLNQLVKLAHQGMPLPAELAISIDSVLGEVRRLRRALQAEPRE